MKPGKQYFVALLCVLTLGLSPLAGIAQTTDSQPDPPVVISEINWAGSTLSRADEWIEIANISDRDVDLSNWELLGVRSDDTPLVLTADTPLAPGEVFLVSNYAFDSGKTMLPVEAQFVDTALSLRNSGFAIILQDADGQLIDVAGDDGAPFAGGKTTAEDGTTNFASMIRIDAPVSGDTEEAWRGADASEMIDAHHFGTPGTFTPEHADEDTAIEDVQDATDPDLQDEETTDDTVPESTDDDVASEEETSTEESEPCHDDHDTTTSDEPETTDTQNEEGSEDDGTEYAQESSEEDTAQDTDTQMTEETEEDETDTGEQETTEASDETELDDTEGADETVEEPTENDTTESDTTENEPSAQNNEEDTQTETSDETPSTENPPSFPYHTLRINELVSNPASGGDEWVEIMNTSNDVVDTTDWFIEEGSGRQTVLPSEELNPDAYLIVKNPSGNLNNTGDDVRLFDPSENVIDELTYGDAGEPIATYGNSLARFEEQYIVSDTPTPGAENILPESAETEDVSESVDEAQQDEYADETSTTEDVQANETEGASAASDENTETETDTHSALDVRLSELLPNPAGSDDQEFIELENIGNGSINLRGWTISDASGLKYTFHKNLVVQAGAFVVLERTETGVSLNNTGDTITLSEPRGQKIDAASYDRVDESVAIALLDGTWQKTTTPTPGETNRITRASSAQTKANTTKDASSAKNTGSDDKFRVVKLNEIATLPNNTKIRVEGAVSVQPGVLGKQIFYIQNKEGTAGIQVYKHDAKFPDIQVGQHVRISGTLRESRNEQRLLVRKDAHIKTLEKIQKVAPQAYTADQLSEERVGTLLAIRGTVISRNGDKVHLTNDETKFAVRISSKSDVDPSIFARGADMTIAGILTNMNGTLALRPRSSEDITLHPSTPEMIAGTVDGPPNEPRGKEQQTMTQQRYAMVLLIGTLSVLFILFLNERYAIFNNLKKRATALSVGTQKAG